VRAEACLRDKSKQKAIAKTIFELINHNKNYTLERIYGSIGIACQLA
jgi:hypothetical protein